jgi:mono/diheme cytochrome c family protein
MQRSWLIGAVALALVSGGPMVYSTAEDPAKPKKLNPHTGDPEAIKEGRRIYFLYSCNACHGGTGGGGMAGADPIFDDQWIYGGDDETLFKLIKGEIPGQVMPAVGRNMTDDEIWKVIAWVRSIYRGDPNLVEW